MIEELVRVRSALFLPASNPRAIEKARGLPADLVILDLEDAVRPGDKAAARAAAMAAAAAYPRPVAIRVNGIGTVEHAADVAVVAASGAICAVLPKAEQADEAALFAGAVGKPVLAMIETPAGVLGAAAIAARPAITGLIAGTNDLAETLRLPPRSGRAGLALALQTIVLAARAGGGIALDGVFNRLDDPEEFAVECCAGRALGFDGKTLIHPDQIEPANRAFGPTDAEVEEAHALVAAASGGAERFRDRMIETMHVAAARRTLVLAGSGA